MFSEDEIIEIYNNKVKLPESYFKKYNILPPCPVKNYNYNWANYDFPRNCCILDFIEWTQKYNLNHVNHLCCTCNNDPELEFITSDIKTIIPYPPNDLHTIGNTYKEVFDFFIFNQTLEHLYNPFEAVKSIALTIKKGGYLFTSVPTINIPHMITHFNGFMPLGLAMLFKTADFEIIEIGQWGNYEYIQKLWGTHNWPGYNELNRGNIIVNEERNVCQTWILVRKN